MAGHSAAEAVGLTIDLARYCDELGYHRFWVAEHHNSKHFANPCPEILATAVASRTRRIRVGSGGVMLSHYNPLKVAECFRMLATLFPDRIDLGIGRAPGGSQLTTRALAWPHAPLPTEFYAEQAQLLAGLLQNQLPADHGFAGLQLMPDNTPTPALWMLGSSGGSARLAGQLGYKLALARFIAAEHCQPQIFADYRQAWQQAGHEGEPETLLAIACICAETDEEARWRAGTAVYRKLSMQFGGQPGFEPEEPLLSPDQVQDRYRQLPRSQQAIFDQILAGYTVGSPANCMDEIERLAAEFGVNEIAMVSVTHTHQQRLDSVRLIAEQAF